MANTYLTISLITFEMIAVLNNNMIAARKVTRTWEKQFAKTGAKIGSMIQIRKPPVYSVSDGATFVPQNYADEMVPLVVDKHKQVGCEFANDDLTLSMDDFSGRFLKPAIVPLANALDIDIMAPYAQVWNASGTPGTIPTTAAPFLNGKTKLWNNAAAVDNGMPMLVTPNVDATLSDGLAGRFNPQKAISGLYEKGGMYDKSNMGMALGWNFFMDQNMPVHTTGAFAGAPVVDGANQTGASVLLKTWTSGATVKIGDVMQFDGVYQVNPVTKQSTGSLQDFTNTSDQTASGGGAMTVTISPSIILVGKTQTVTAAPADGATVYMWGTSTVANVASKTSPQCMGWQEDAITLACVDLMLPDEGEGVKAVRVSDDQLNISMTFMRSFDPRVYGRISRIDMLYGVGYVRPEHVVRVAS